MNNAATPDGRGHGSAHDAEPLFPSEGPFNPVVPLSEIESGRAPARLARVDPADVGKPAEAEWAREAHRAGLKEEEETTLVPPRAGVSRRQRRSWLTAAGVVALSVAAGLASGTYLIWTSQREAAPQASAQAAPEAPTPQPTPADAPTPAPAVEEVEKVEKVEKVEAANEPAKVEKSAEVAPDEVVKVEKPRESARPSPTPRAERPARAAAEPREVAREPRPARTQSAPPARPRATTAARRPPAPPSPERALPISTPPPTARSKRVIQWP